MNDILELCKEMQRAVELEDMRALRYLVGLLCEAINKQSAEEAADLMKYLAPLKQAIARRQTGTLYGLSVAIGSDAFRIDAAKDDIFGEGYEQFNHLLLEADSASPNWN